MSLKKALSHYVVSIFTCLARRISDGYLLLGSLLSNSLINRFLLINFLPQLTFCLGLRSLLPQRTLLSNQRVY